MPHPTPIGRPAKGLPRYYMDVGWYRHPKFAGLAPDVLFVFEAIIGYCTQFNTGGRAPSHHEDLGVALGVRPSLVKKALPLFIQRGAVVKDGDTIHVDGYTDHNPSAAEVEQRQQEQSKSGSYGNHVRWHENKGITAPDCEHCRKPDRPPIANGIADPIPTRSGSVSHGMGWDGMGNKTPSSALAVSGDTPSHGGPES